MQFTVYCSEKGAESIRLAKDNWKSLDANVNIFCSIVNIASMMKYVLWLKEQHALEFATHTEFKLEGVDVQKFLKWARADHGDPGFHALARMYVFDGLVNLKCMHAGLHGKVLPLVFAGIKSSIPLLFARDHSTYGPRLLEDLFRLQYLCARNRPFP
jgi:hypothetical protein